MTCRKNAHAHVPWRRRTIPRRGWDEMQPTSMQCPRLVRKRNPHVHESDSYTTRCAQPPAPPSFEGESRERHVVQHPSATQCDASTTSHAALPPIQPPRRWKRHADVDVLDPMRCNSLEVHLYNCTCRRPGLQEHTRRNNSGGRGLPWKPVWAFGRGVRLRESLRMSGTVERCLHDPYGSKKARKTSHKLPIGTSNDNQSSTTKKHGKTREPCRHEGMHISLPCVQSHVRVPEPFLSVFRVSSKPITSNLVLSTPNWCSGTKPHLLHDSCDCLGHIALQQLKTSGV